MINLPYIPAFGFETASWNATDLRKNERKTMLLKELAIQQPTFVIDSASFDTYNGASNAKAVASAYKVYNFVKVLGYIPIIGTLVGAFRIAIALHENRTNKISHLKRGCVELFSIGFILLIADIYFTKK